MLWIRQFPVVSSESQNFLTGSRMIYGITFGKKITITDVLKNSSYFYNKFSFYRKVVKAILSLIDLDG
jgi:hypothetical protein